MTAELDRRARAYLAALPEIPTEDLERAAALPTRLLRIRYLRAVLDNLAGLLRDEPADPMPSTVAALGKLGEKG